MCQVGRSHCLEGRPAGSAPPSGGGQAPLPSQPWAWVTLVRLEGPEGEGGMWPTPPAPQAAALSEPSTALGQGPSKATSRKPPPPRAPGGPGGDRQPHQRLLADDEQPAGPAALGQPHFLVEGAVPPRHQGDLVTEAFGREVGRRAEHGGRPVPHLQKRLQEGGLHVRRSRGARARSILGETGRRRPPRRPPPLRSLTSSPHGLSPTHARAHPPRAQGRREGYRAACAQEPSPPLSSPSQTAQGAGGSAGLRSTRQARNWAP